MQLRTLQTGLFKFSVESDIASFFADFNRMYADYPVLSSQQFVDFEISIHHSRYLRRVVKPQANFSLAGVYPFKPLPVNQAYAMLEWGMNWCIAQHAHHYHMLHAAVIEKNGVGIVMPADSGSGKSTLTAALMSQGWRLLSDEIALINLSDGLLHPLAKPINLKNTSIDILRDFYPDEQFSSVAYDTHKGTVALLKASDISIEQMKRPCQLKHFVFPRYLANAGATLSEVSLPDAFKRIIDSSFNYSILGEKAFTQVCDLLQTAKTYSFTYSDFDQAFRIFDDLAQGVKLESSVTQSAD